MAIVIYLSPSPCLDSGVLHIRTSGHTLFSRDTMLNFLFLFFFTFTSRFLTVPPLSSFDIERRL